MDVEDLLASAPALHRIDQQTLGTHALSDDVLRYIDGTVDASCRTLETGAGMSTILFAIKQTHHICISPDQGEFDRIREFCGAADIGLDRTEFIVAKSQNVLPTLSADELDIVLIDGDHAFPMPFIDFYYATRLLRLGGRLILDDTMIHPCRVLDRFLREDPAWILERTFLRASIFRTVAPLTDTDWNRQPFVVRNSEDRVVTNMKAGFDLLRKGSFRIAADKTRRFFRATAQRQKNLGD